MCMMGNVSFNIPLNLSHERSKGRGKGNLPSKNVESIKKLHRNLKITCILVKIPTH